jgi:heme exporter protein A
MTRMLIGTGIRKRYGVRTILRDVDVTARGGDVVGIVGDNGSGKSTLVRILAGVLTPDAGSVSLQVHGKGIAFEKLPQHVGFVAPYLRLYDEFTAAELLHVHARLHGTAVTDDHVHTTLARVGLGGRQDDVVRTFSSGLQQRVAIALAVHLEPDVLVLDEPSVTLDRAGRDVLEAEITRRRQAGGIILLATNDDRERSLCTTFVHVSSSPASS